MNPHKTTAGRRALYATLCTLALTGTAAGPARAADELCVTAAHAATLYDYGWQAYQREDWIPAHGHLEFYYLLTVNTGQLQRDQGYMQELIAAKNHAYQQLVAMRDENGRLRAQIAKQGTSSSGIGTHYQGVRQAAQSPTPPLRRAPPPNLR